MICVRDALKESLEEKKRSLEESLDANEPEAQAKLLKLREVELEQQSVLSEIRKRYIIKLNCDLCTFFTLAVYV